MCNRYRPASVTYVRDVFGHKVTHAERLASIEARLMKALEGEGQGQGLM